MHLSGYTVVETVEQTAADRLATARLQPSEAAETGALLDLLFASSGIENEIVAEAECVEILSDLLIPVARIEHLIARKTNEKCRAKLEPVLLRAETSVRRSCYKTCLVGNLTRQI